MWHHGIIGFWLNAFRTETLTIYEGIVWALNVLGEDLQKERWSEKEKSEKKHTLAFFSHTLVCCLERWVKVAILFSGYSFGVCLMSNPDALTTNESDLFWYKGVIEGIEVESREGGLVMWREKWPWQHCLQGGLSVSLAHHCHSWTNHRHHTGKRRHQEVGSELDDHLRASASRWHVWWVRECYWWRGSVWWRQIQKMDCRWMKWPLIR